MAAPKKKTEATVPGNSLRIMNMSGADEFCTATGRILPKNGMVWRIGDDLFINRSVAKAWAKTQEAA